MKTLILQILLSMAPVQDRYGLTGTVTGIHIEHGITAVQVTYTGDEGWWGVYVIQRVEQDPRAVIAESCVIRRSEAVELFPLSDGWKYVGKEFLKNETTSHE